MSEVSDRNSRRWRLLGLLWGIVVRPRAALEHVSEHGRRTWWLPALLAVLLVVLPIVVASPITARESRDAVATVQEQFGEGASGEEQAQMEQAMSLAASPLITVVFPAVAAAVGRLISWLIWAGVLYLAGMTLGGRGSFGQMFPVIVWAGLPCALRGLLQTAYIALSGEVIANPGLSGLVPAGRSASEIISAPPSVTDAALVAFLSRIDLFLVWNLILLAIGVGVSMRLSRRKSVLVTLGVWALLTALGLIPALIGAFFARQVGIP